MSSPGAATNRRHTVSRRPTNPYIATHDPHSTIGAQISKLTKGGPELRYTTSYNWPAHQLIDYLIQNSFSVPGSPENPRDPYVTITSANGRTETKVPTKYRIPLLWVAQFMWKSVQINLPPNADEWDEWKYDILHVSILLSTFLAFARDEYEHGRMHKNWRWSILDRPLVRYWHGWLLSRTQEVDEFNNEYGEEFYGPHKDVLDENWKKFALDGVKGFVLTKEQIQNGMAADSFHLGLRLVDGEPPSWPIDGGVGDPSPSAKEEPQPPPDTPMDIDEDVRPPVVHSHSGPSDPPSRAPSASSRAPSEPNPPPPPSATSEKQHQAPSPPSIPPPQVARRASKARLRKSPKQAPPPPAPAPVLAPSSELQTALTQLFSTNSLENAIPLAITAVVQTFQDSERRREEEAQNRIDQVVLEMQEREQRLVRIVEELREEGKRREEELIGEVRRLMGKEN